MEFTGQLPAESSISDPIAIDIFKIPPCWYEDGDIFLLVEGDNQMEHKFRIHRLMLYLHSPVFRDMLSLGENIVKEGDIATVPMKGDSVEDVRELLKALYNGFELCSGPERISFEGALSVLRLSHKYQMERLKRSIVKLLQQSWPLNYTEYNQVLASLSAVQKQDRIHRSIKLINAARLTECYELLPCAFYELSNSNCATWTFENGAGPLCSKDWLRMTIGKILWMKRLKALESAGLCVGPKVFMWAANRDSREQLSIFQTRSQYRFCSAATSGASTIHQNVRYCLGPFRCLKSLVGGTVLDGKSLIDGCKSWTTQTFQDENACEGCAKWMSSLIRNKEIEIWDNVIADFDLPEVDKDEYTKTRSFF